MPTEADLLAGIVLNPDELERWLILSDWLEDQGDPRCELARLRYLLQTEPDSPQKEARLARQLELLDAGLSPVVPQRQDNVLATPMGLCLPGSFLLGSPPEEDERQENEQFSRVTLSRPYFLGLYPVTVGEFRTFVEATGYRTEAEAGDGAWALGRQWRSDPAVHWDAVNYTQDERFPVVCVSWNDAMALVDWMNSQAKPGELRYGLPLESQWEHACRAGTSTAYWWGDDAGRLTEFAWYKSNADNQAHSVESKRPNPWGFWHLHGLVLEWCADDYHDYPSVSEDILDDEDAPHRVQRPQRGGSWNGLISGCRSAYREPDQPSSRYTVVGFRLAGYLPAAG